MFHPDSKFKQIWDALVFLLTIYAAIEVPMRIVMDYDVTQSLLFGDIIVTTCFAVDMIFSFRTKIRSQGVLVSDPKRIAKNYLSGWFIFDFFSHYSI